MSKCWYCNSELTSGDSPKHLGVCNKCYDEMFKSGDTIIRSLTNKIEELQKMCETNKKLQEKVKKLECDNSELVSLIDTMRYEDPKIDELQKQMEEKEKMLEEENKQLTELYDELNKRYCKQQDELDIVREENKQIQKQLEIHNEYFNSFNCNSFDEFTDFISTFMLMPHEEQTLINDLKKQLKQSQNKKAIEVLEKVLSIIKKQIEKPKDKVYQQFNYVEFKPVIDYVESQITELDGEKNERY